jgi:hypothetical protein
MKIPRNSFVVGIILSVMLSSTAFANPLAAALSRSINEANNLNDVFNKSTEDTDSLIVRIQDAINRKDPGVYLELRSLADTLNKNFKNNDITLIKLQVLKNSDCALALADTSKSNESLAAIDACYELRDAAGAATDARGATAQGLDLLNNVLSKYVALLESQDAERAKAQEEKDAAAAKAQIEAERAAAELKVKEAAAAKGASESQVKQKAEAAAVLKAKQDAEAKAAATKKTTITCVKGKLTKKVTAVNPKCPSGYKKK